jgi:SAM-dependent methyltransferase
MPAGRGGSAIRELAMSHQRATVENPFCTEDLAQLAATQYRLADRYCESCRNYHAMWPYRRIARSVGAAAAGAQAVEATLAESFGAGRRRVLVAGAADSGLLALTARAGAAYDVDIVVLDRCRTPLEACRQFSERWSLRAEVQHADLTRFEAPASFDIVLAHSVLMFIAPAQRVDVLARLRRALRPNGRLVHFANVGAPIPHESLPEYRARHVESTLAELERHGVALPEARDVFSQRFEEPREGTFNHLDHLLALHEQAGLDVTSRIDVEVRLALPLRQAAAKLGKRRYILVAEPAPQ